MSRTTNPKAKPARSAPPSDADGLRLILFCIEVTALLARDLEEDGHADRNLYPSIQWMKLLIERKLHSHAKKGIKPDPILERLLPTVPQSVSDIPG